MSRQLLRSSVASGFIAAFKYSFLSFDRNLTTDRIALVVGNSDYGFSKLTNAPRDAEAVCASLSAKGFKIIKRIDPSRKDLIKAIYDFQVILSTGGVGVFYYAGHAGQIAGQDLILPVDADVDTKESYIQSAVNLNDLLGPVDKIIEEAPRHNGSLVICSTASGATALDEGEDFGITHLLRSASLS